METYARLKRLRERLFQLPGRQARPARVGFNLFKTLMQALFMWAVFLVIAPLLVLGVEAQLGLNRFYFGFSGQIEIATLIFIAAWIVSWTSAYFMASRGEGTPLPVDATRKLVVAGPYRFIRNPMAFSSLLQGAAIGLGAGSPLILLYVLAGVVVWNYLARPWEEADLERKFGEEYRMYCREVRCWMPRWKPYSSLEMEHPRISSFLIHSEIYER